MSVRHKTKGLSQIGKRRATDYFWGLIRKKKNRRQFLTAESKIMPGLS